MVHVVFLAAGVGKRLAPDTQVRPKCLLEVGGRTLLERHLRIVESAGARRVTVVVGHLREMIEETLRRLEPRVELDVVFNAHYRRGSIVSLATGLRAVEDDVLFMDTDVLYHPNVLGRLFRTSHPSCLLIDSTSSETGEEMMVGVRDGRAVAIARRVAHLGPFEVSGESVGFFRFARAHRPALDAAIAETLQQRGEDVEYEDALNLAFSRVPVGFERVDDLDWTEIDFAEDLRRAREDVFPRLPASLEVT